jgi:hypothetical protein
MSTEFDLNPDPRILPMLGEINLAQWRCLAELVDNSVDGFLNATRAGVSLQDPEVSVNLPTTDAANARVSISDNGPGMTPEVLERAVRAGWSGNNPIDSLGLFGMGFNIATARLGALTTVWTSRVGEDVEHGLQIDFDALRRQRHFRTPHLTRAKVDPSAHGTTITIERLKLDQRAWLARAGNRAQVKRELSRAYSSMLRASGVPISFKLTLNGTKVPATNHCVWDEARAVDHPKFGPVHAVIRVDQRLPDRPFCVACWQWLAATDPVCPACGRADDVIQRKRHVHGWVGLQRYLNESSFGVDFIRNGRKIEIGNRDLFYWRDPNSDAEELEYPIDDPRNRGRFVGEIHLDHCRVTYMKDRFDRTDPAWAEMVGILRGEGPLQPQKASGLGYANNASPLFRLFQVFRRSSPPNARVAGGWANVLVVRDNDEAERMAKKFHEGEAEYQTDAKWWDLVVAEDNKLLTPGAGGGGGTGPGIPGFGGGGGGGSGTSGGGGTTGGGGSGPTTGTSGGRGRGTPPPPPRTAIPQLTRQYLHDASGVRWDVKAFDVQSTDPDLEGETRPWRSRTLAQGDTEFLVNPRHPVFRSATLTPLDALLAELAHRTADFIKAQPGAAPFAVILADLRDKYGGPMKLDAITLANNANLLFRSIALTLPRSIAPDDGTQLFAELPSGDQEAIHHRMAARGVSNPLKVVADGRFLEHATPRMIIDFIKRHPELFFDGRCWEAVYSDLDYQFPAATAEARARVLGNHEALLLDALWLAEQDPSDAASASKERILRSALAVDLLAPVEADAADGEA